MNPNTFHDPDQLRDAGVHLTPYGVPEYPKAAEISKLRRQIAHGITMPSGTVIEHDEEMIDVLGRGWLHPEMMVAQFKSPRFKSTRAGMTATVSGFMPLTALQTNTFNPRPKTKLDIPAADSSGRVPMPWAPTDRKADPQSDARVLVRVGDRDELNHRILENERHIVADQGGLADLITREGIQEDVLAIIVRYETGGLTNALAVTSIDGNSRVAIARAEYRDWISRHREEILGVVKSPKPRAALTRLIDTMRDGLFPLEFDDVVAMRHFQKAVAAVVEDTSTAVLLETGLYSVPSLFVVPVTTIVAFEPADKGSTVLDAADQMMRNVHHPARAPMTWDQASGHSEIRDEVVGKLHGSGSLSIGEALHLGPRFEEAAKLHGEPAEPDRRAFAAIELVNGNTGLGREARGLIRDAIGTAAGKTRRAQIITAIQAEQVRSANAQLRKSFETTMHDLLGQSRYGSVSKTPVDSGKDPDDLLAAAVKDQKAGLDIDDSPAMIELGLKGGTALAALGHLVRFHGTKDEELRPYQAVDNMLKDESGLGMKLLTESIEAWRKGTQIPEYDVEKKKPIPGAPGMRPTTLAALFPNPDTSVTPAVSARDMCDAMRKVLADQFQPILDDLLDLPEVGREGAPADAVGEVLNVLVPARQKLELQAAKYEEFHGTGNGDAGEGE